MNKTRIFSLTLIALATLAGCGSLPNNTSIVQARSDYLTAYDNKETRERAGPELMEAGAAVNTANEAWTRGEKQETVDHLAYLAKQKVAIAREIGKRKTAEQSIDRADALRDKVRLEARTEEADKAHRATDAARMDAGMALARNRQLEAQILELNAKQTPRGLVVTIGDVFFDTDKAEFKEGGARSVEKLAAFLKEYPQRTALVEGYTDSTGTDAHNQALSSRRAEAVRSALVTLGVSRDRIDARGFGEAYPVAANDNASSRQLNRRVEILLSDENGKIAPR